MKKIILTLIIIVGLFGAVFLINKSSTPPVEDNSKKIVQQEDKVRVDTRTGDYLERA